MAETVVRVVTADETVEFALQDVIIRHKEEGVQILPSRTAPENTLGFKALFYPWGEVRQIKEYERA